MADEQSKTQKDAKNEHYSLVPSHMAGGPMGLGDPDDKSLRKVEREITIPKLMKEKSKEKCADFVKEFVECSQKNGLLMPFKCRQENRVMQECQLKWFQDPEFYKVCREEYLIMRTEYRKTGISQKAKRKESATF